MNVRAAGKRRLDMQFFLPNYWPHSSAVDTRSTCTETLMYFSAGNGTKEECRNVLYCISLHTDIDECVRGADNCDINVICSDTEGSFNCTCVTGYEGDGVNCTSESYFKRGRHIFNQFV